MTNKLIKQLKESAIKDIIESSDKQYAARIHSKVVPEHMLRKHMKGLLTNGRIFDTAKLTLQKGKYNKCILDVVTLWAKSERLKVVKGFRLDGELWNPHHWLWNPTTGELIETATAAKAYFGEVVDDGSVYMLLNPYFPPTDVRAVTMTDLELKQARQDIQKHLIETNLLPVKGGSGN
jgi:hypothetical protein